MREAADRAEAGAPEGTLVCADEQTAGRGRLGRDWVSPARAGLYLSLVLRPPAAPSDAMAVTLACGLGVARALGKVCGIQCDIRWPNDVMLSGKKCAGILTELVADGENTKYIVVGIGVNINHDSFPPELEEIATSLRVETGCEWARDIVLETLLTEVGAAYTTFLHKGSPPVVQAFSRASSYANGRRVEIDSPAQQVVGTTAGLDERGILLVRQDDGVVVPVLAGGVRPLD